MNKARGEQSLAMIIQDKDGVCSVRGKRAKKMWKPAPTLTRGTDGSLVRKKGRVTYYVCDLGRVGRGGKLSQMRKSSFFKTSGDRETLGVVVT